MTYDIVDRLKVKGQVFGERLNHTWQRLHVERLEAAKEITRLRDELRHYADMFCEMGKADGFCGNLTEDQCSGCKAYHALKTVDSQKPKACGGCGETNPSKRCFGCFHDFGTKESAWVGAYQPAQEPKA